MIPRRLKFRSDKKGDESVSQRVSEFIMYSKVILSDTFARHVAHDDMSRERVVFSLFLLHVVSSSHFAAQGTGAKPK